MRRAARPRSASDSGAPSPSPSPAAAMVPATSSNLLRHDSGSRSRAPYCAQYCVAAQLDVAMPATAAPARKDRLRPTRSVHRRVAPAGEEESAAAAGTRCSRSRGNDEKEEDSGKDWLQLGLPRASSSSSTSPSSAGDSDSTAAPAPAPATPMEMDLFADKRRTRVMRPPLLPPPIRSYHRYQYGHDRYKPPAASGSSPAPPFLPFARPLRSFSGDLMLRVIAPPPRTPVVATGLWLTLQPAPNQVREPLLPQIQKSYLRIKDSNMKVELVMKYLADKLGLTQSQQVELTCRGQLLPPFLLVKYVRDAIWCSPAPMEDQEEEAPTEPPPRRSPAAAPTTTDHVMTLFYSTSRSNLCNQPTHKLFD